MSLDKPNSLERCAVLDDNAIEPSREVITVPQGHRQHLSAKQVLDYYEYRKKFLVYLLKRGKNPEKANGYAPHTVYNTGYRAAAFDLLGWKNREGYNVPPSYDDAAA